MKVEAVGSSRNCFLLTRQHDLHLFTTVKASSFKLIIQTNVLEQTKFSVLAYPVHHS